MDEIPDKCVVKDTATITLYGTNASNGVILKATKKGKTGKIQNHVRYLIDLEVLLNDKIELFIQEEYLD